MADATAFNLTTGTKADRNMMVCYANVGTTAAPEWEALGFGVEDSAIELNLEETIKTDILGVTTTSYGKPQRRQSFEPCEIREGSDLQIKLYNILRNDRWSELSNFDCLIVHKYVGTAGTAMEAERYTGCGINVTSLGGSTTLDMPFEVVYGGTKTLGTAAIAAGVCTFTPAA